MLAKVKNKDFDTSFLLLSCIGTHELSWVLLLFADASAVGAGGAGVGPFGVGSPGEPEPTVADGVTKRMHPIRFMRLYAKVVKKNLKESE